MTQTNQISHRPYIHVKCEKFAVFDRIAKVALYLENGVA